MTTGTSYIGEIGRKSIHLSSALIPLIYVLIGDRSIMLILLGASVLIMLAIELLRRRSPGFRDFFQRWCGFMLRTKEQQRLTGSTFVLLAAFLTVLLYPQRVAVTALLILSISDSLASLIGIKFGRVRYFGKSVEGSLAFFASALAITWLNLPGAHLAALAGALAATLAEAVPLKFGRLEIDDNLAVPLIGGAVMTGVMAALPYMGM